MKIECDCGMIVYDGADPQPDKGFFATSEAKFGFLESHSGETVHIRHAFRVFNRVMLQCSTCGRLYVQGRGEHASYYCFVPKHDDVPRDLLCGQGAEDVRS